MTAMDSLFPGMYVGHPVAPVEPRDPLAGTDEFGREDRVGPSNQRRLKIAFAAHWGSVPHLAWSGSTPDLFTAFKKVNVADIDDIGIYFPSYVSQPLRIAYARYRDGKIRSSWHESLIASAYRRHALLRQLASGSDGQVYDAALTINTIADLPIPFYTFYDEDWDANMATADSPERFMACFALSKSHMKREAKRRQLIYEKAHGIIAASHWFARCLIQRGVPSNKVHVVHLGASVQSVGDPPLRERPRRKLLFVGRSRDLIGLYRKGGDLVVEAFQILRKEYDPELTLTMAGVVAWPNNMVVPEGVTLLSDISPAEVSRLYDTHDLFVLPSRHDSFGKAFVEAQAHGLPCVGRNAFAMPEIILPGVSGALIRDSDPKELADAIASVLVNDEIYKNCRDRASRIAEYFSWERAAREIAAIIAQH